MGTVVKQDLDKGISGEVRYVGIDLQYSTVQSAIDAANPGDTILISPGHYYNNSIVINKHVHLRGLGSTPEDTVFEHDENNENSVVWLPLTNSMTWYNAVHNIYIENLTFEHYNDFEIIFYLKVSETITDPCELYVTKCRFLTHTNSIGLGGLGETFSINWDVYFYNCYLNKGWSHARDFDGRGTTFSLIKSELDVEWHCYSCLATITLDDSVVTPTEYYGSSYGNFNIDFNSIYAFDLNKKINLFIPSVTEEQINFSLLVNLTIDSGVKGFDATNVFTELETASKKIAIIDKKTGSQLFVEIENWDYDNKSAQLHIKVPIISATEHTTLIFYYDSGVYDNVAYVGNTGSEVAQQVWANIYKFVSHQAQDPTGSILDSTQYTKHGTSYGSMTSDDLIDGSTGKMIEYDGTDDFTNHGYDAAHDIIDVLTIRAVIKPSITLDSGLINTVGVISRQYDPTGGEDTYMIGINNAGKLFIDSNGGNIQGTTTTWEAGSTFIIVATYNLIGLIGDLFVNGIKETLTVDSLDVMTGSANNLVIGKAADTGEFFPGSIDEVQVINAVMSDEWVAIDALAIGDNLIILSEYEWPPLNSFLLNYANAPTPMHAALEAYHISKIPTTNIEQYALVEEKDITRPEGYQYRIKLKIDADKINSAQTRFKTLVHLEHQHLFDTVKKIQKNTVTLFNMLRIYVSPDGYDSSLSGSPDCPCRTLNHALSLIPEDVNCQILLYPGEYHHNDDIHVFESAELYISGTTGDYQDVKIICEGSGGFLYSYNSGAHMRLYNLTVESYCANFTFFSNYQLMQFYNVFLNYKGSDTEHYWGKGSSIHATYFNWFNCTIKTGVGEVGSWISWKGYNTICDTAQRILSAYYSCYPGSTDTTHNNIDYDTNNPEFSEIDSAEISFGSLVMDKGSSEYQSWYDGSAPDIGCHEVGAPTSRSLFTDKDLNVLDVEVVEWNDVNNTASLYVSSDILSEEDSFIYVHYANEPVANSQSFMGAEDTEITLFDCVGNAIYSYYWNMRTIIRASHFQVEGSVIRIHLAKHNNYEYTLDNCFVGHIGESAPDFDGNQVRVTFNGGSHSITVTADGTESDVISFELDPSRDLVFSFHTADGWMGGAENPLHGCQTYKPSSNEKPGEGGVDESALTNVSGYQAYRTVNWSLGVRFIEALPAMVFYWDNYDLVLHGNLRDTGDALDSTNVSDITTSPTFDDNYIVATPFGPGLDLSYSATAHLITDDVFSITEGTIVAVFKTDNISVNQVLFSTPASASTNQHLFEITTTGAIQITDAGGTNSISTETGFNDGEYHTIIFNWDVSGRAIEVDKNVLTISNNSAIFSTEPFSTEGLIGYDYVSKDSAGESFDGIISEFRLAKISLSGDTVETIGYSETDTLFDSTISSNNSVLEEYGAGSLRTFQTLEWIITHAIVDYGDVTLFEEPWVILQPPNLQVFEEVWGIKLLNLLTEAYGDIAKSKNIFVEWYDDGANPVNTFAEKYNDAESRKAVYSLLWMIQANPKAFINEQYSITENTVLNVLEELYAIKENDKVTASTTLPYYMLSEEEIVINEIATVSVNGTVVQVIGFNISAGLDQYGISASLQIAEFIVYELFTYMADVVIEYGGITYIFVVDGFGKEETNEYIRFNVKLKSPSIKLDIPYAETITDSLESGANSKALIIEMAAIENITVDYSDDLPIWNIPSYAISINEESPLQVIKKIANSIGAVVQSKPNGDLLIISKYPISPTQWDVITPDVTLSTDADIININESFIIKAGFNAFLISDQGSSSKSISIEEENINKTTKIVKGFRVPFDDGPFPLETSAPDVVTISKNLYPVSVQMPEYDGSDPDLQESDKWEIIEFIDHVGTTSKPIYGIVNIVWLTDDLGAVTISEDGTLTVSNPDSVPTESLMKIQYITKYWEWTVTGPDVHPVQVFVPEISEE